ncbi:MAG: type VI secretion system ImpA family N-terminal domain-containing protein, partial [Nannocystaceae bacterium]
MTTAQDVRTRAQALLAPISEAEPGGADAAYDPELDAIKSEVGKLDSPTGGEVDWEMVTRDSQAVLTGRSKDLLIACYAAYGLYETEKLPGLAVGLAVLEGLLEEYWETMFPPVKRKRGRGNALGWLVGRLEIALPLLEPSPADRPALDLVIEGYKKLGAKARDRLEDHAPGMRSVSDALQRLDLKVPKAQAEPEPATPAAEPAGGDAAGGGAAAPAAPEPAAPSPPPAAGQPAPAAAATTAAPSPPTAAPPPDKKDLVATSKEAAKTWLEPLGDPPHGIDARYEADFESIRAEVAKLDSPADDTEVDWEQVGSMADGMLRQTTKDLLLASYFVFARLLSGGLEGLSVGLCVLIGMFEGFEKLWPKRPRGQGNALSWLTDQLERQLSTLSPSAEDRDILEALQKILRELGGLVRDRLEDNSPSMRPLEERVQRMLLALPKPEAAKPPPPPKPAAAPPPRPAAPQATAPRPAVSAPAMPAASADVGSAEEVGKYLQETGRA